MQPCPICRSYDYPNCCTLSRYSHEIEMLRMERDRQMAGNDRLNRENAELKARIAELEDVAADAIDSLAAADRRVAELEAELATHRASYPTESNDLSVPYEPPYYPM